MTADTRARQKRPEQHPTRGVTRGAAGPWGVATLLAVGGLGLLAVTALWRAGPTADGPPTSRAPATVSWSPDRPVQGHLFTVRVTPAQGGAPVEVAGSAAGEELHFERTPDGGFESLAAVPVDTANGLTVTVRVTLEDGREETHEPRVPVAEGAYRHEQLTVAPELGGPLGPERQARLDRDREKAAEVSRQAHLTPRLRTAEAVLPRPARVTSGFGNGREFNGQISSRHMGLDLAGAPGDTVVAATRGVVELVDEFLLAGNIVYLNHGAGLISGYFHLSRQLVQQGDTVEAGAPIGLVGATGRVTGPHLHWVVRYGTTSVDPRSLPELPPEG